MISRSVVRIFLLTFFLADVILGSDLDLAEELSYQTPLSNSSLFLPLLASLATQNNSPDTSQYIKLEYDYIIVGAGAAGSVVASRLSEKSCVTVLLLEAGPRPPHINDIPSLGGLFWFTKLSWQYETVPQRFTGRGLKNRQVLWPSGKGLGGSTILNNGLHVRGNKKNYNDWSEMGAKGWSYEEVLPYFIKLEDNRDFEYVRDGYHGVEGPITVEKPGYNSQIKQPLFEAFTAMGYKEVDPNARNQTGFYDIQANLRNGQRCTTAKAYLVPVENRANLDILPNAFVRKVIIENGKATGVVFDHNCQTYRLRARREVILSAGAVKTPQILMLSGIGPAEHLYKFNIPVLANLPVGMNLQDHCGIPLSYKLKPFIPQFTKRLFEEESIKQYIFSRTGPLASNEGTFYVAFLLNNEINPEIDFPNNEIYFAENTADSAKTILNLSPEFYNQVYKPYENSSLLTCFPHLLQPKSRGRISLRSTNPYDNPIIDPNYLADPNDIEDLVQGLKVCRKICNRDEMRQVIEEPLQTLYPGCEDYTENEDAYYRCVLRAVMFSFSHYCCTAKMGDFADPTTVVDPQLRVKYIKGLRVVDASIMPIVTSGNTGVPAIMIGEKAADLIKETIECIKYK